MAFLHNSLRSQQLLKAIAAGDCYLFVELLYSFITTLQNYLWSTLTEVDKDQYMTSKETPQTFWRLKIENTGQLIKSCEFSLANMSYTELWLLQVLF